MKRKKLKPEQAKQILAWAKKIYSEVDDSEFPQLLVDEAFDMGYNAGYERGYRNAIQKVRSQITHAKKGLYRNVYQTLAKIKGELHL